MFNAIACPSLLKTISFARFLKFAFLWCPFLAREQDFRSQITHLRREGESKDKHASLHEIEEALPTFLFLLKTLLRVEGIV